MGGPAGASQGGWEDRRIKVVVALTLGYRTHHFLFADTPEDKRYAILADRGVSKEGRTPGLGEATPPLRRLVDPWVWLPAMCYSHGATCRAK
jgi:hypothetical protein